MDLDPNNKVVVLAFEYVLTKDGFDELKKDFQSDCQRRKEKGKKPKEVFTYLKDKHVKYFQISKKSLLFDVEKQQEDEDIFTDLIKEKIQIDKIINFKCINARRGVSNKDTDKTLSSQSSRIYKKLEAGSEDLDIVENFKDVLSDTDESLDAVYKSLFKEIVDDVSRLGGVRKNDSKIQIASSLQHKQLLEENTTVTYSLGSTEHFLPENYNGLGYMNLISMIFEIKILLHDFQKKKPDRPADINLLFIEEPEAHTHPQMQYIFIKNIKVLLDKGIKGDDGKIWRLQTILTTHSSHIVSESEFEDIKYLKKSGSSVESKNLKDLKNEYGSDNEHYKFLKQYLTLNRAELFFADKAIFIEGDTERILLPAMMKKIDQADLVNEISSGEEPSLPLLSQNVSIVEVGAYSQIFEKFIDFIGVKSLIVTDIDSLRFIQDKNEDGSVKKNEDGTDKTKSEVCKVEDGEKTSNSSIKYFLGDKNLKDIISLDLDDKVLKKNSSTKDWEKNSEGHLLCIFQVEDIDFGGNKYHARSFEDAFFHVNKEFISTFTFDEDDKFIGSEKFPSLTQSKMKKFAKSEIDAWDMASAVSKKPAFAMEILLNSQEETVEIKPKDLEKNILVTNKFSNWHIPAYINEGLRWLKRD